jgi:hypothetical protein
MRSRLSSSPARWPFRWPRKAATLAAVIVTVTWCYLAILSLPMDAGPLFWLYLRQAVESVALAFLYAIFPQRAVAARTLQGDAPMKHKIAVHFLMFFWLCVMTRVAFAATFAQEARLFDYESLLTAAVGGLCGGAFKTIFSLANDNRAVFWCSRSRARTWSPPSWPAASSTS